MVHGPLDPFLSRTVRAAVQDAVSGFDSMADDAAAAVSTGWSEAMNGALERIEHVRDARRHDLERPVIIVPAHFALRHAILRGNP